MSQTYTSEQKTSTALPNIIDNLLKTFTCKGLLYVKGPGSFMAIKISYIYLRSLSITLDIPLLACEGFCINNNKPIKAYGKVYFVKNENKIETKIYQNDIKNDILLPNHLKDINFTKDIEPLYVLPAV